MAAYGAPTTAQHEAESRQQSEAASFKTPLSRVTHLHQPASPPTQPSLPPNDCRWKRGRPVTFSGRAFSTRPARYTAQVVATASTPASPDVIVPPREQDDGTPLNQSRQQCEQLGNTATPEQQRSCLPHILQHTDVHAQTGCVVDGSPSSKEASAMNATVSSPVNLLGPDLDDQNGAPATHVYSTAPSSEGGVTEDVSDTDYVPTSSHESDTTSEQDGSEADEADAEPSETHTPLEFQIPEDTLRAAMAAPENTKASFWSSNLYRGPEDSQILVHYCKTKEVAERVAKHFVNEKVVGFDIEWRPFSSPDSVKKNVSLIQLACENRIALFHIAIFQGSTPAQLMPPTLKAILESPNIYKVGVAVKGDFSRIIKYLNIEPQGVFELSRLHNLVEHYASNPSKVNNKLVGLAPQVQQHLQLPLYKGGHLIDDPEDLSNVRSSDWSLPLNHQQIHYAAADAYAGFRLFDILEEKRKQLKPAPPRPLVCDYDAKPKPRPSVSKPRKKRTLVMKDEQIADVVAQESITAADEMRKTAEEAEESLQQSQDTEGYETAQEGLSDSHQVEDEVLVSSEEDYESTDKSDDDVSIDAEPSSKQQEIAAAPDANQRRVGRINLNRLRNPDPGYPTLPKLRGGDVSDSSSDEDLIDISGRLDDVELGREDKLADVPEEVEETDEFDDVELEEALQYLNIDGNGKLREAASEAAATRQDVLSEPPISMSRDSAESGKMLSSKEVVAEVAMPDAPAPPAPAADDAATKQEEQRLIDLIDDPDVAEYLHAAPTTTPSPAAPTLLFEAALSESLPTQPALSTDSVAHTPEYALATAWARTYLSQTIPPLGSLTPSHIRATVPHLRAYHMWEFQRLPLGQIARQLRNPPLAESTAGSYVLQAIKLERMVYDAEAVRALLMGMPSALRRGKWKEFAEKVGAQ